MGQDRGLWLPPQRSSSLSPGLDSSFALSHSGHHHDTNLVSGNFTANMVTVCGSSPVHAQLPLTNVGEGDTSHGLVYGLSDLRSPLAPPRNPCLEQISSAVFLRNHIEAITPKNGNECAPKRFLVFDQSGDQTTLIFSSSDLGERFGGVTTGSLEHCCTQDMKMGLLRTDKDSIFHQGIVTREEFAENCEPDVQSEMREDTEELNALLYSDHESDYSDEDEVTSSGHSPSMISSHCNGEALVGSSDGISASIDHSYGKKRKRLEGCDYEDENDDAESSCGYGDEKKTGKEKISETLSLIRSVVPCGDTEDPIFVIDTAIDYLKSLKMKAETLGLESLGSLEWRPKR